MHPYTAHGYSAAWLAALDVVHRELIRRLSGGEPQLSGAAKSEISTAADGS
jgi:hypothetical protein